MMGADGGLEIAKALMARCWISAHDEVKRDRGVAVKLLNCDRNSAELVTNKIRQAEGSWKCDVRSLDAGAEVRLRADGEQRKKSTYSGVGLGVDIGQFRFRDGG